MDGEMSGGEEGRFVGTATRKKTNVCLRVCVFCAYIYDNTNCLFLHIVTLEAHIAELRHLPRAERNLCSRQRFGTKILHEKTPQLQQVTLRVPIPLFPEYPPVFLCF